MYNKGPCLYVCITFRLENDSTDFDENFKDFLRDISDV